MARAAGALRKARNLGGVAELVHEDRRVPPVLLLPCRVDYCSKTFSKGDPERTRVRAWAREADFRSGEKERGGLGRRSSLVLELTTPLSSDSAILLFSHYSNIQYSSLTQQWSDITVGNVRASPVQSIRGNSSVCKEQRSVPARLQGLQPQGSSPNPQRHKRGTRP